MDSRHHPGFSGYLLRARIDPGMGRPDGAVAIVFDAEMRVVFHPAGRGDLVMEARVCDLPEAAREAGDCIERAAAFVPPFSGHVAHSVVLAQNMGCLLLQQRVAADASADEFEEALGAFLDALSAWRVRLSWH